MNQRPTHYGLPLPLTPGFSQVKARRLQETVSTVSRFDLVLSLAPDDVTAIARYLNIRASGLPLPCDLARRDAILFQIIARAGIGYGMSQPPIKHPEIQTAINGSRAAYKKFLPPPF